MIIFNLITLGFLTNYLQILSSHLFFRIQKDLLLLFPVFFVFFVWIFLLLLAINLKFDACLFYFFANFTIDLVPYIHFLYLILVLLTQIVYILVFIISFFFKLNQFKLHHILLASFDLNFLLKIQIQFSFSLIFVVFYLKQIELENYLYIIYCF